MTEERMARARQIRALMNQAGRYLTDEQALTVTLLYPAWREGEAVDVGELCRVGDILYRCAQSHVTQADWMPPDAPALWTRVWLETWPDWSQPTGAQDAYALGARVTHEGARWVSVVANNVWTPGVYGWTLDTTEN